MATKRNPYAEIRFLNKDNVQEDYCRWQLSTTFNGSWQPAFYHDLEEKLYIMQELEIVGFGDRSAIFKGGMLTTYHFLEYQMLQCIEHTADHLTLVVRDL